MTKQTIKFSLLLVLLSLSPLTFAGQVTGSSIDSTESYDMVVKSPESVFIVDIRTRPEYEFVGHADVPNGSANIPYKLYPGWRLNDDFVAKVSERYSKDSTLILMCRSGKRAKAALPLLKKAGFENVLYMSDSFEGAKDKNGHRTVNGWKVNGLPYTYRLDESLVYKD